MQKFLSLCTFGDTSKGSSQACSLTHPKLGGLQVTPAQVGFPAYEQPQVRWQQLATGSWQQAALCGAEEGEDDGEIRGICIILVLRCCFGVMLPAWPSPPRDAVRGGSHPAQETEPQRNVRQATLKGVGTQVSLFLPPYLPETQVLTPSR